MEMEGLLLAPCPRSSYRQKGWPNAQTTERNTRGAATPGDGVGVRRSRTDDDDALRPPPFIGDSSLSPMRLLLLRGEPTRPELLATDGGCSFAAETCAKCAAERTAKVAAVNACFGEERDRLSRKKDEVVKLRSTSGSSFNSSHSSDSGVDCRAGSSYSRSEDGDSTTTVGGDEHCTAAAAIENDGDGGGGGGGGDATGDSVTSSSGDRCSCTGDESALQARQIGDNARDGRQRHKDVAKFLGVTDSPPPRRHWQKTSAGIQRRSKDKVVLDEVNDLLWFMSQYDEVGA